MRSRNICASILFCTAAFAAQSGPKSFTCATCHVQQGTSQPGTSMAHALLPPAVDRLFKTHPKLTLKKGAYSYTIETQGDQTSYSVTDGAETVSVPIRWVFGAATQTYVLERNGQFYESLVSYYNSIDGLDTTIGDQAIEPKTVQQAFGRLLAPSEVTLCFGCHSTGSVIDHRLHFESLQPGVKCEHCHAGAETHFQAVSHSQTASVPPHLKQLSPEEISSFCGQCHRSWETVVRNRWFGPINVRFQPYRLENSRCFDGVDRRLSCTSCHDPHQEVSHDSKTYDAKCLACHSAAAKPSLGMTSTHPGAIAMKTCPVSKTDCVSCHMPKINLPGGHRTFTDHTIRVVRANEPYPN